MDTPEKILTLVRSKSDPRSPPGKEGTGNMKRLTAFFTAFVLFLVTAAGIHLSVRDKKIPDSHAFSTWANETKTRSVKP